MKIKTLLAVGAASVALFMTGCTVEQTEEGSLPDVDMQVEGETRLPSYDVDAADVDMGTTRTEVTVPTVDVNMPQDNDATPAPANP